MSQLHTVALDPLPLSDVSFKFGGIICLDCFFATWLIWRAAGFMLSSKTLGYQPAHQQPPAQKYKESPGSGAPTRGDHHEC